MARSTAELAERIASLLAKSGIPVEREPAIGGVAPDFFLRAGDGRSIILEAKSWPPTPANVERAQIQADYYKALTGADASWVVIKAGPSDPAHGVVALDELPQLLHDYARGKWQQPKPPREAGRTRRIFVAMPFDRAYDDTYFVAIAPAAKMAGGVADPVNREEFTGDIVQEIHRMIRSSVAIVADLSESNPNVMYELGFAMGLPRPAVMICSTNLGDLPFDVRNLNVIPYAKGQTNKLLTKLAARLRTVL